MPSRAIEVISLPSTSTSPDHETVISASASGSEVISGSTSTFLVICPPQIFSLRKRHSFLGQVETAVAHINDDRKRAEAKQARNSKAA